MKESRRKLALAWPMFLQYPLEKSLFVHVLYWWSIVSPGWVLPFHEGLFLMLQRWRIWSERHRFYVMSDFCLQHSHQYTSEDIYEPKTRGSLANNWASQIFVRDKFHFSHTADWLCHKTCSFQMEAQKDRNLCSPQQSNIGNWNTRLMELSTNKKFLWGVRCFNF